MKKRIAVIVTVALCLVTGSALFATSDIGFKGVGPQLGFISPSASGLGGTIGFGGVVDLGTITPQIGLEADVLYWSKSHTYYDFKWSYSQFYITAVGKYYFEHKKDASFEPYAGAGLGLCMGTWKTDWTGNYYGYATNSSMSTTSLVFLAVGGVKHPFSPKMYGFGEARYMSGGGNLASFWGIFAGLVFSLK
jgi:hypothetical protein